MNETLKLIGAFIPIIWLLVSLAAIKMPAYQASTSGLAVTAFIALLLFGMSPALAWQAALEGFMLAVFPIIYVIISALFVYNITVKTGGMDTIKKMLSGISPDRRVQALILAFGFGGFLEAVAGFGTAVAIPAGIMAAMGFEPLMAAAVCLVANTIPVAFGVLGIPVITLAQVTGLPVGTLSFYTALQLIPFVILLPAVLIYSVTGSIKNIKGAAGVSFASGAAFAAGQTATAVFIGPELAAVAGSLFAMATVVIWVKLLSVKNVWRFESDTAEAAYRGGAGEPGTEAELPADTVSIGEGLKAWSPYILILLIILATRFVPFLKFLDRYPFTIKKQFYFGPGGKPLVFQLAAGGGTILLVSAVLGGFIQGASIRTIAGVFGYTLKQLKKTAVTVVSIVALAKLMGYSGMISTVAGTLAALSGRLYPLIAPLIGALGTFITGSDTSSNVLFGDLQKQTAIKLGADPEWLVAANASGATAGKMISPQSISIATAATGLGGKEGKLLGMTARYCVAYVILMGVLVLLR